MVVAELIFKEVRFFACGFIELLLFLGSARTLYQSVHEQILSLPDDYFLFPAHDYQGQTVTTVKEEKEFNPRLSKNLSDFIEIMNNLKLPYPHQIGMFL